MTLDALKAYILGIDAALNGRAPDVEVWAKLVEHAAKSSFPAPINWPSTHPISPTVAHPRWPYIATSGLYDQADGKTVVK